MRRKESMGYQVNHLGRLLAQALRDRIAHHGVVPGQFAQLLALYEEDGLTQSRLRERVSIDQSTMAHTLQRMERDGLVRRVADHDDRRRAIILLTEHARGLEHELVGAAESVNKVATRGFTREEVNLYRQLTDRMIHNLETAAEATAPEETGSR
ncbi:MarR family winged helix-turn-helix transcriptional regulator [Amycolatopsis nigrescens]|uniref:MarR family winged helix-turn-helix transcriptional regulator n=1 Tax=Amycolatopsis nigrescens TaxID=381445 RepID=UPI0003A86C64|nr:MarR family transcriptional regulator [Amycolatopsis nigrescens]